MQHTIINNKIDIDEIKIVKSSIDEKILVLFFNNAKIKNAFELTENEYNILQDEIIKEFFLKDIE